jgi:hypothetical protein
MGTTCVPAMNPRPAGDRSRAHRVGQESSAAAVPGIARRASGVSKRRCRFLSRPDRADWTDEVAGACAPAYDLTTAAMLSGTAVQPTPR